MVLNTNTNFLIQLKAQLIQQAVTRRLWIAKKTKTKELAGGLTKCTTLFNSNEPTSFKLQCGRSNLIRQPISAISHNYLNRIFWEWDDLLTCSGRQANFGQCPKTGCCHLVTLMVQLQYHCWSIWKLHNR